MGRYDYDDYYGYGYKPYVPVAERRAQAAKEVAKRIKKGQEVCPIRIDGRNIASTFWGKAWCANLESYSDYSNRLPRGRTYVRNGSVVHLKIDKGRIEALVSGSELYEIQIDIAALPKPDWQAVKKQSAGKIGTLVELLQGKLSNAMMELVTDRAHGLFPKPKEIKMRCSCPDGARMCKHLAAVMYGVGSRLDSSPELLFALRGVGHMELIEQAIPTAPVGAKTGAPTIAADDLGAIFDIEIGDAPGAKALTRIPDKPARKKAAAKASATKEKNVAPAKKVAAKASPAKPKNVATVKKATTAKDKGVATVKKAATTMGKKASSAPKKK
jgi:uncharacterized Zn finger protein